MYAMVSNVSDAELKSYIRGHFKNSNDVMDQAIRGIDYVQQVKEVGVDKARLSNTFYLTYPTENTPEKKPLFSQDLYQTFAPEDAPPVTIEGTELTERGTKIKERYADYHRALDEIESTDDLPFGGN
jgi:hypothetical protein